MKVEMVSSQIQKLIMQIVLLKDANILLIS